MGFFSMVFGDPLKSTAEWGALLFKRVTKQDWDYARAHQEEIFLRMVQQRPGTPDTVRNDIRDGLIYSLTELCWRILVSEGYADKNNIRWDDFPEIDQKRQQIEDLLIEQGIPKDLA